MTHVLQQYDTFADLAMTGEKNLEVRRNTLGFQKGDRIRYEVVERRWPHDPVDHPLNDAAFEVTHVISNRGLQDGYVAFGIKKIS